MGRPAPNIGELLGVLDRRLYATTMSGGPQVLDEDR